MVIWDNPAIIGLLIGAPSAILGYLAYRRSTKLDKVADTAGIATANVAALDQVIESLHQIIDHLQKDNAVLRTELERLNARVKVLEDEIIRLRQLAVKGG